ncbi:MAG: DEAD/DEAH box helicase family protein [Candidatus Tectomicrobia bacterium]|nr:DEAD/DEAH box helicase family protein [Candidatus Tectomicrobia bacterium]
MAKKEKAQRRKEKVREKRREQQRQEVKSQAAFYADLAFDALRHEKNLDKAKLYAEKAIRMAPNLSEPYSVLAEVSYHRKEYERALTHLLKLHQLDPTDISAWQNLMLLYTLLKQYQDAITFYEETVRPAKRDRIPKASREIFKTIDAHFAFCRQALKEQAAAEKRSQELTRKLEALRMTKRSEPEHLLPEEPVSFAIPVPPPLPAVQSLPLTFSFNGEDLLEQLKREQMGDLEEYELTLLAQRISLAEQFDSLLCLNTLNDVEHYWYQIETVKRVLKSFRGRVLLCDEVGLGKTIEAGMLLKEYLLRGLVQRVLILCPPSLISQWEEELLSKFDLPFVTTDHPLYRLAPDRFWQSHDRILASIHLAKLPKNFENLRKCEFDLVIVDEAHHLKNRSTVNWKLVNTLKKKFIFLLTATPIQNDLMELYNLITLLRPGTFKTVSYFRKEFMERGDPRSPKNREHLRTLLKEVMVRNTRSLADIKLPRRFASTVMVKQSPEEAFLYQNVSQFIRDLYPESDTSTRLLLNTLQMEAGSSPFALRGTLKRVLEGSTLKGKAREKAHALLDLAQAIHQTAKGERLLELVQATDLKKIIFTRYLETLQGLAELLREAGIPFALFHGGLSHREKDRVIEQFQDGVGVLLSSESGGEGRNLQFCNSLINFDLPWNPMQIEQRIGRIHRIGQTRDVFIFNLCAEETIESYVLSVLDRKINMFELVVGEIGMILGNLADDREFPDIVMDLWIRSASPEELQKHFNQLGEQLLQAKVEYQKTKALDEDLLAEDYEV